MNAVTLQFSTEDDVESRVIRWFTHSRFSHVDAVLPDGRLLGARIEGGVQIRDPGYARWSATERVTLATDRAEAIYAAALSQVGKPYDWRAILGFAAGRDWRDDGAWICSELACWALERGGYFGRPLALTPSRITPGDLLFALSACSSLVAYEARMAAVESAG